MNCSDRSEEIYTAYKKLRSELTERSFCYFSDNAVLSKSVMSDNIVCYRLVCILHTAAGTGDSTACLYEVGFSCCVFSGNVTSGYLGNYQGCLGDQQFPVSSLLPRNNSCLDGCCYSWQERSTGWFEGKRYYREADSCRYWYEQLPQHQAKRSCCSCRCTNEIN